MYLCKLPPVVAAGAAYAWLRSPNYNNSNNFCNVNTDGSANNNNANNSYAVLAGFCNAGSHAVAEG